MRDSRISWSSYPNGLETVATALQECNEPLIQRDLTLTIYFIKVITDIYGYFANHKNTLPSQNPGWRMWLENLIVPESSNFKLLYSKRLEPGNGERIDAAFKALIEANNSQLNGISSVISFNSPRLGAESRRDGLLQNLLEITANLDFEEKLAVQRGLDVPSNGFRYLLRYFATHYGKKTGDIIPPQEITQLITKLLEPKTEEDICDSACHSGSMLIDYKHYEHNVSQYRLCGQEGNASAWALAKMNLFLNGCDCRNIQLGSPITNPVLADGSNRLKQFDVIISNLLTIPEDWGVEYAEKDPFKRFTWGVPLKNKGEYGFIQHMIASMKAGNGRMAVIVPRGVLFRGGSEALIRRKLIEENLLTTVICLPEKLFYGAIIPVAVLVLNARKPKEQKVLFIDASRDFQTAKPRNTLRNADIDRILETYRGKYEVAAYSHLASAEEIKNNDYNLNMPRYVQSTAVEFKIDPRQIEFERKLLLAELLRLDKEIEQLINFRADEQVSA